MKYMMATILIFIVLLAPISVLAQSIPQDTDVYRALIGNVQTRNTDGVIIGTGHVGSTMLIQSEITLNNATGYDLEQKYTYYAQVKVSEKNPYVEYVGVYEGVLETHGTEIAWVMWTPERTGLYYVETYVWDDMMALTSPGPISLILIV
ncbi:MAG: hypothetical protein K8823_453 [Cenarchaeum symbiont of Oopsacas minuta]|nr:hypothetical protein [Cenarchaeum symbiont of Oopsacas minuta]